MEEFKTLHDLIEGFVKSGRGLVPHVRGSYGLQLFAYFSIVAVLLKISVLVLSEGADDIQNNISEVLLRVFIIAFFYVLFYWYDNIFITTHGWINGAGQIFSVDADKQGYFAILERLMEIYYVIHAGVLDDFFSWGNIVKLITRTTSTVSDLLVKEAIWSIFGIFVLFIFCQLLVLFTIIKLSVAAALVLGPICIPFGVFEWSWANSVFYAWLKLCLFTFFVSFLLLFMLFLTESILIEVTQDFLADAKTKNVGYGDMFLVGATIYFINKGVALSMSLAQEIAGAGGGVAGAGRSSIRIPRASFKLPGKAK